MGKRKRTWSYIKVFYTHVRGTAYKQSVYLTEIEICTLPKLLHQKFLLAHPSMLPTVYVHTKVLKHIYDDHRTHSREIIIHLGRIMGSPDAVYENKQGRKGLYLFTHTVNSRTYFAVVEPLHVNNRFCLRVRTGFYASKPRTYVKDLKQIWKRP